MARTGHNILAKPKPMDWLSVVGKVYIIEIRKENQKMMRSSSPCDLSWKFDSGWNFSWDYFLLEIWFELKFFLGLLLVGNLIPVEIFLGTSSSSHTSREIISGTPCSQRVTLHKSSWEREKEKKNMSNNKKSACAIEEQVCWSTCIIKEQTETNSNF